MSDDKIQDLAIRVTTLEARSHAQDVINAQRDERNIHIEATLIRLDDKMANGFKKLDSLINRIVWLILAAGIAGVMNFILSGGLVNVTG